MKILISEKKMHLFFQYRRQLGHENLQKIIVYRPQTLSNLRNTIASSRCTHFLLSPVYGIESTHWNLIKKQRRSES